VWLGLNPERLASQPHSPTPAHTGEDPHAREPLTGSLNPGSLKPGSLNPGSLNPGSLYPGSLNPVSLNPPLRIRSDAGDFPSPAHDRRPPKGRGPDPGVS